MDSSWGGRGGISGESGSTPTSHKSPPPPHPLREPGRGERWRGDEGARERVGRGWETEGGTKEVKRAVREQKKGKRIKGQ